MYPDESLEAADNYCRNPSNYWGGLWCYTADPDKDWERCDVPKCNAAAEIGCYDGDDERTYTGRASTTIGGRKCQAWAAQSPFTHEYTDPANFPEETVEAASNYCRNPSNWHYGLWCYTLDSAKRFERCDVPRCNPEIGCRTGNGRTYTGKARTTVSGRKCQAWNSNSPHHNYNPDPSNYPDASLDAASNYCRNPSNYSGGLWCYTQDPDETWELCEAVPEC